MSTTLDEQINQLKQTIADIESQRPILGDEVVEASLKPIRQKLADLETQLYTSVEVKDELPTRQRKLVTLLYIDVVGSTAMTQHLDPEDTLEIMDNALPHLAAPIESHGGHVTRYTGDGFKAVFGDPVSRENDPEQAIRAGLNILDKSQALAKELKEIWEIDDFQVRIGIDTGLAALGGQTEAEDTIMGRVVNLAVRIESAAPPGGLLISHNTYRHVRGVFNVEPQEPIQAKGFPEPVPVYLVDSIKPRAFRMQTRGVEGVETRMVGRRTELDTLKDALLTAFEEGEGQVVTITGEAGVGKSRLLYELQNWIELLPPSQDVRFFQGRGHLEAQGLPYSLLRDLFAFRCQILDDDSSEQACRKIEASFRDVFGDNEDAMMRAHILGQLLGYDFSASPHLKGVLGDAEQLRNRSLMYIGEYFQAVSAEMPTVLFLEDIHWADDSSLDALNHLGHRTPQQRTLIVCAARHALFERRPHWGEGLAYHRRLELEPLSMRESRQLVAEILQLVEEIPSELRELVVRGAEGNPFYIEELIKMLVEDGVVITTEETWHVKPQRLAEIEVPSTLAGVLQARLDSLPVQERIVLQQASVVGRLFWDRLVAHIHAAREDDGHPEVVTEALISLRGRELVYRREESAFADTREYIFKHDVLREVTYESVLRRLRRIYHGLVADWLIEHSAERISEYAGPIADHLLLAGRTEPALTYLKAAGEVALASYANMEAEGYFRRALELSPTETEQVALFSGLGETLSRQSQYEEALEIWRQGIALYQALGDNDGVAHLYARSSQEVYDSGDISNTWSLCQEGLALLEGTSDSQGLARLLAEAGRAAYFSGMKDEVESICQKAVSMAERLGDVEIQLEARNTLSLLSDDLIESVKILEEVVALAEAKGLLYAAARAHNNLGYQLLNLGELASSHQQLMWAADTARKMGHSSWVCGILANLARTSMGMGDLQAVEDILTEIQQLKSTAPESRAQFYQMRVQKLLLFSMGDWSPSLELARITQAEARQGGDLQDLCITNENMADAVLELNRFAGYGDWTETEAALAEAIEISERGIWDEFESLNTLAILRTRQGRLAEANHQLEEVKRSLIRTESPMDKEHRLRAEFELAFAEGRWQEAVAACETRLEISERMSARWIWARSLIDLADTFICRKEPGDLERAHQTYQQSLDMFTQMGAPGYIKVLEERLGDL